MVTSFSSPIQLARAFHHFFVLSQPPFGQGYRCHGILPEGIGSGILPYVIIDLATAQEIDKSHYDAIIAPEYESAALELLGRKKSLRLVKIPMPTLPEHYLDSRCVRGGFLTQTPDFLTESELQPRTVTKRQPTEKELSDLIFAWKAVKSDKA